MDAVLVIPLVKMLQKNDGKQDHRSHKQIGKGAEISIVVSASEGIDPDRNQRETDRHYHRTSYQGREKRRSGFRKNQAHPQTDRQ